MVHAALASCCVLSQGREEKEKGEIAKAVAVEVGNEADDRVKISSLTRILIASVRTSVAGNDEEEV